jgi:hypothetical protein
MSDFNEIPKELESEYNKIMGVETGGKSNKVDEAYMPDEEDSEEVVKDVTKDEPEEEETEEELEEESEQEEEQEEPESEDKEGEEEDIPEHLVEAGRREGWSDEKIIQYAENDPDVLERLAQLHEQIQAASVQREPEKQELEQKEPEKKRMEKLSLEGINLEEVDEGVKGILQKLVERDNSRTDEFNAISDKMEGYEQQTVSLAEQRQREYDSRVDGFFDGLEDFPDVGKTVNLSDINVSARLEIHEIAKALSKGGGTLEQCLDKAVKAYKGMYGREAAEQTLRRKLDKSKKKFTPRPGGQKTSKKFTTEKEAVEDALSKKLDEFGVG